MKVMITVTHLLGAGHLMRAHLLARGFAEAGHEVCMVSGGRASATARAGFTDAGYDLKQLPAVASDGVNFTRLLDEQGNQAGTELFEQRRADILAAFQDFAPDILITELFPFGRRVLADEFLALLEATKSKTQPPLVLASIRDILAPPSTPAKAARTSELVERYYDGVLVHSDANITALDASWPVTPLIEARLRYTGYVGETTQEFGCMPSDEILVSAGSGVVGGRLFENAILAAMQSPDLAWRMLVAGDGERRANLANNAPDNVMIEPLRADYPALLANAACSVSMCGYNTALDILTADTPSVLIPFDDGGEVEQTIRAQTLSTLDGIEMLTQAELTPDRLLNAINEARRAPKRDRDPVALDGAAQSVRIACEMREAIT